MPASGSVSRASTSTARTSRPAFPPRATSCPSSRTSCPLRAPCARRRSVPTPRLRAVIARYYPGAAADLREIETVGNVTRFERRGPFSEEPAVTRVAVPNRGAVLDSGYLVVTWDRDNVLRHTLVSGRGQIVHEELRTNTDSYRIFQNHPGVSPQTLVDRSRLYDGLAQWLGGRHDDDRQQRRRLPRSQRRQRGRRSTAGPVSATPAVCRPLERRHRANRPHQPEGRGDQPVLPEQHRARQALRVRIHRERGQLSDQQLRAWRVRQRPRQGRSPGRRRHQQRELRDAARRQPAAHADVSVERLPTPIATATSTRTSSITSTATA